MNATRCDAPTAATQSAELGPLHLTRNNTVTLLHEFPHHGIHQAAHLAVDGDGSLLLIGATQVVYSVWRIETSSHHAKFKGLQVGIGSVLDRPFQGEHGPLLPVVSNGKLSLKELDSRTFAPGGPCNDL
jgi:hypothetical protein